MPINRRQATASLFGLGLTALLSGCKFGNPTPDFKGTDISNSGFGRQLALTDHNGIKRTLDDFKGKLVVLFFGYTHCPDVCPTTLSDMAAALKSLTPDQANQVQVLFVSVDTERDNPAMLKAFVPYFYPSFLGLYGTADEVATAAQEFKVFYRKHVEPGATDYLIDHTAGSYVLDQQGQLRLFLPFAQPAQDIAHDLRLLLGER